MPNRFYHQEQQYSRQLFLNGLVLRPCFSNTRLVFFYCLFLFVILLLFLLSLYKPVKCLIIDKEAKTIQAMLNQIIVGRVLIVDVITNAKLDAKANKYSHHHCLPNSSPGKMMHILVAKAQASTVFTFVQ